MLTPNGARRARSARFLASDRQRLRSKLNCRIETACLKVARRQRMESVKCKQVCGRAQLTILGRRWTESASGQLFGIRRQLAGKRPFAAPRAANCNRLDVLRAEHG